MQIVKKQLMANDIAQLKQILQSVEQDITNELDFVEQTCKEVQSICEYSMIKKLVEPLSHTESLKSNDTASLHSLADALD